MPWAATVLVVSVGVAWVIGGAAALAYAVLYALATLPGWPLGFALFGRRHAAGWLSGVAIGYGLTAIALWIPIAAGHASAPWFAAAWGAMTAVTWGGLVWRGSRATPLIELPAWGRRDTAALLLVLLLVPLIFVFPYRNLGAIDDRGTRYYRAYFTADFVWHMALTSELSTFTMPPANPYFATRTVHYYWTYFLLPATIVGAAPAASAAIDVENALKINAYCSGFLFAGLIALATWCAVPRAGPMAAAVALGFLAPSLEGIYALYDFYARGIPFDTLRETNIDAITAWRFDGLRIDSLARSMWYTPQHSMACALGLVAIPVAAYAGAAAPMGAIALAGVALGLSATFNPLLGGLFAVIYGAVVLIDAIRVRRLQLLLTHSIAAAIVALAIGWSMWNEMFEGAGGALRLGVGGNALNRPVLTLVLSLGALLIPAAVGLWPLAGLGRPMWPGLVTIAAGLALFYGVRLSVDSSYIGFRAGQLLQIGLIALVARGVDRRWRGAARPVAGAVVAALFAVGLPTTLIDTYNAQDIGNLRQGPTFRWTITVTAAERQAFDWIQRSTPRRAIVQMDPLAHGRETWTLIPSFAQRRMAAGLPISLLSMPEYAARATRVRSIYEGTDVADAWAAAGKLRIDYLYVGRPERAAIAAEGLTKFDANTGYFTRVFANADVSLYSVNRHPRSR